MALRPVGGTLPPDSDFQYCRLQVSKAAVAWWDENHPESLIPPSAAVFQPVTGETGHLLAGTPVAGVAYKTPTQNRVTGLDGSFQYEEGEIVRFMIGNTVLGDVAGQEQVTPFDLAGSAVLTGVKVSLESGFGTWNLRGELYPPNSVWEQQFRIPDAGFGIEFFHRPDPFDTAINLTVLLQSLDQDANPGNGIMIRPGVANLFQGVSLNLRQDWCMFLGCAERQFYEAPGEFPTLRFLLGLANKMQRFSVAHGAVRPAIALQRLYETLGIDSRTHAICPGGWDFKDSEVDCQYDANGNLTWLMLASGSVTRYEYDAHGNRTRQNGQTWQYDALGNLVRATQGDDGDGIAENIETWQYDVNGKPIRAEGRDENGSLLNSRTWQYDTTGNLTRYEQAGSPDDGYGRFDWKESSVQTWKYGASSNLTRHETDRGDNQILIDSWFYDGDGNLSRFARNHDRLGTPGEIESWQFHTTGWGHIFSGPNLWSLYY